MGWRIEDDARYFVQVNHSALISDVLDSVFL